MSETPETPEMCLCSWNDNEEITFDVSVPNIVNYPWVRVLSISPYLYLHIHSNITALEGVELQGDAGSHPIDLIRAFHQPHTNFMQRI